MKTILHTLIAAAAFLIQTSYVNGQNTYQTARRYVPVSWGPTVNTDSNNILQPGVGIGCATITSQPVWFVMGGCISTNFSLKMNMSKNNNTASFNDTASVVVYGPFTDTLNLSSKLINSNIDTCMTSILGQWGTGDIYIDNSFNYSRGDIYIVLAMSTHNIGDIQLTTSTSPVMQIDSAYCPICNGRISQLFQPICVVGYDSASQKNKLVWTKDIFTPAQDYVVYRNNAAGTYDTVAYQSISQLSEYVDVSSSPLSKAYVYRMGIRDSCGQITDKGSIGNWTTPSFSTMHLIAYPTGNNSSGLIWNSGSFYSTFLIYRTDPSGVTTLIDSVGYLPNPQTYTDINAPAGMCSYQIGVYVNPPCVASVMPSYTIVKSNPGYVTVTGINELADLSKAINIEPNPFNQFTKIDLHLFNKQNTKVILRNLTGQVVMQFDNVKTEELIIERNNLSQGLYFLEVTGDGFYARKKVVVE